MAPILEFKAWEPLERIKGLSTRTPISNTALLGTAVQCVHDDALFVTKKKILRESRRGLIIFFNY